jgi:hypothetical protein
MTFWEWFQSKGDDAFVFLAGAAVVLQQDPDIPKWILHYIVDFGLIAGLAHKVFFPTSAQPGAGASQ